MLADAGARYARELVIDLASIVPTVALPHSPDNVMPIDRLPRRHPYGIPRHVHRRPCRRLSRSARRARARRRQLAAGVRLVVTPASSDVERQLDRQTERSASWHAMGATITMPGCGACCGTSGVIPDDGMNVLSTANRNFKARMGNATASIYLASPAACAAAALTGRLTDPRDNRL